MTWALLTLCTVEAIALVFVVRLAREDRDACQFWYESSCRAWNSILNRSDEDCR